MKIKIIPVIFILISVSVLNMKSQGVYVPVYNSIYDFLERMEIKGVINYSKVIKPLTRKEISSHLTEVNKKRNLLNRIEQKNLDFHIREYYYELNRQHIQDSSLSFFKTKNLGNNRFEFLQYCDPNFNIVMNPIIGGAIKNQYDEVQLHRWGGASAYFNIGHHWGGQMDFRDNWEKGDRLDRDRYFTPATGIQKLGGKGNEIEYSEVKGSLTYESKYFNFSAGKDWFNWGSGYRSQLILSQKAPSFPFIRFDLKPVKWMRFYYIHGWLNSRVPDSSEFYKTQIYADSNEIFRIIDRPKFYAAHIIEFTIKKRIRLSLGESVVYSDQGPKIEFLVPFLIFRLVDHYNEGSDGFGKGSNSQAFIDLNVGLFKKFNFYSTLFIDEFSISNFLKGNNSRNQIGYTIGASTYDFIMPNLLFRLEYTRILPWVYSNFIQTQTYTNCNYLMGHYIGQNADQLFAMVSYYPMRGLKLSVFAEYVRNGGFTDVVYQYQNPGEDFLYGSLRKENNLGISINYELIHDLFITLDYQLSEISDEDKNRTQTYMLGNNHLLKLAIYYGL